MWAKLESSDVLNGQFLNFYLSHDQIAALAGYTFDIQSPGPRELYRLQIIYTGK